MMNEFVLYLNERRAEHMANKSRKGLALIEYLIVNRGKSVTNQRLMYTFWADERVTNPENALKTLVSRMRAMLNQVSPELGSCIVADRGAYRWQCLPEMTIDLYELEDAFKALETAHDSAEKRALYQKVMKLYRGALLKNAEQNEWAFPRATALHNQYVASVYAYVELLKQTDKQEDAREIVDVCRHALESEPFDDRIHIELMRALLKTNCTTQAKAQFDEVMHLHYHYLGVKPSQEIMDFYDQIVAASKSIDNNLESICRELYQSSTERGAFVCDFPVFKEIFNLQIRNIERLDSTMFLAVIMISKMSGEQLDGLKQESVMRDLIQILRMNLRRGDVITHFSPTMIAILLPTVDYSSGDGVMERIKKIFYQDYPNSDVLFNYRIAPLATEVGEAARQGKMSGGGIPQVQNESKEEKAMKKEMLETVKKEVAELMAAGSCCKEAKDAAQAWLDAVGTDKEAEQAQKLVAELEEDIMPIDGLIAFAGSDMGAKVFGADMAKNVLAHAESIKAAGGKYCDCPACAACEKILAHKAELIG